MAGVQEQTVHRGGLSQFGEHLDIEDVVGLQLHGYAVDVGACDGVSLSNTKQLEDRGWNVLCIEANPFFGKALRQNRKNVMMVACGAENMDDQDFHVYEVQPGNFEALSALSPVPNPPMHADAKEKEVVKVDIRTLNWCLMEAGFPRVDVVSIDVEGGEEDVLDGFDIKYWQPKIIVIEDWAGGTFHDRLGKFGLKFKNRRGVNDIYVRE